MIAKKKSREITREYAVTISSVAPAVPDVRELNVKATFSTDPNAYGNGTYIRIDGAGLGFNNVFDARYDKRLGTLGKDGYIKAVLESYFTGKHGAYLLTGFTVRGL